MRKRSILSAAAILVLLSGCATVNYSYRGQPCEIVEYSEDEREMVLRCPNPERVPYNYKPKGKSK